MNYLSAENISRNLGERWLFKNLFFGLQKGEKVALIGKNGTGKTTLMESLMGMQTPDEGKISIRKGIRVGYLPQNPIFAENEEVLNYLFSDDLPSAVAIKSYEKAMLSGDSKELEDAFALMEAHNAWDYEARAKQIISRLGIPDGDQKVSTLSGGQKKRLSLAKLLIESPDIMILDEPTNHLDIETIEWLEGIMSGPNVTVLVVSHDRYFLDNAAGWILELDRGHGIPYEGNYTNWLETKEARLQTEAKQQAAHEKTIKAELEWVRANPKGRQSKSKARIARFEELNSQEFQTRNETQELYIPPGARLGDKVLEVNNLCKGFDEKTLIDDLSFGVPKGSIVGIIGGNGAGKTTFLRMLVGDEKPDSGSIELGDTVQLSYVDQSRDALNGDNTVWQEISDGNEQLVIGRYEVSSRSYASRFNFRGGDQQKFVKDLSGGERNRLHMAKLLKRGGNVLLLDEPTNDLDVETLRALEEGLLTFPGCAIVVSHDRWFLDRICTHILAFEGDSQVVWHEGNYSDYEIDRKKRLGDHAQPTRMKYKKLA